MRKRKIIKRGINSFAIALMHSDMKDKKWKEGNVVDIDDLDIQEKSSDELKNKGGTKK